MGSRRVIERRDSKSSEPTAGDRVSTLLTQYGCGPIQLSGTGNALYERHIAFDNVIDVRESTARHQFEAFVRSVRDVLSQRWVVTEQTYARKNVKRVYYLSMEFLIGRLLANNVTNLLLDFSLSIRLCRRTSTVLLIHER